MDQGIDNDLLILAYQTGVDAVESRDWSVAVKWLKPVYEKVQDYEEVHTYYCYAIGMLAYEKRHWNDALKYLQVVNSKLEFKDCKEILTKVIERQSAATNFSEAQNLVDDQKNEQPANQEWEKIIILLDYANKLDPEHEAIRAKAEEVRKYQSAQKRFLSSLEHLQKRNYKEALKELDNIDDGYKQFCPSWATERQKANEGIPLQDLYDDGCDAMLDSNWSLAALSFQKLYDQEPNYPGVKQFLDQVRNSAKKPSPHQSKTPIWKNGVFWAAVGAIAAILGVVVPIILGVLPLNSSAMSKVDITNTAVAIEATIAATSEIATAEAATTTAKATETATAMVAQTTAAEATETATAMVAQTTAAEATETATAMAAQTAAIEATETATAMAARETAMAEATETATAMAARETTAVVEANEAATAMAARKTATAVVLVPTSTPTPIPTPTLYLAPILTSPDNGQGAFATFPALRWSWKGALKEDEFFEVRIWHESITDYHPALGWVKEPPFDFNISQERSGKYYWTVVVVKGRNAKLKDWIVQSGWQYKMWDGDLIGELSPENEPRFFIFTPDPKNNRGGSNCSSISCDEHKPID